MRDVGLSSTVEAAQAKVQGEVREQVSRAAGSSHDAVRRSVSGVEVAEVAGQIADPIFRDTVRALNIPSELAGQLREEMMVFIKNRCAEISQANHRRQTEQGPREEQEQKEEQKKKRNPSEERQEAFNPESFDPSARIESPRLKVHSGERGERSVPSLKSKKSLAA